MKSSTLNSGGVLCGSEITKPREKVGTDNIMLVHLGLVPQDKGSSTCARIGGATFCVDYSSKWVKVHLVQDASRDLSLEAKNAPEQDWMMQNITPCWYHTYND